MPGQELQPQVAIVIDLRVLEPGREVRRAAGVGREQVDRRVEPDLAERLRHLRVLRALRASPPSRRRRSSSARPGRSARGRSPGRCSCCPTRRRSGTLRRTSPISLFTAAVVALVELHEERHDAAGVEVLLDDLEELLRVERRRALDPRIERIGRDRVELLLRRQQEVPRVVDVDRDLRILDDVEVVVAEVLVDRRAARAARSRRSSSCSTFGPIDDRAGRDARAAADDERRSFGAFGISVRQVAEHALQAHVLRLARRLHLAGVVIVAARRSAARTRRRTRSAPRRRR